MTLPSRKKHRITAQSTMARATATKSAGTKRSLQAVLRRLLLPTLASSMMLTASDATHAQQGYSQPTQQSVSQSSEWRPSRLPATNQARPLSNTASISDSASSGTSQNGNAQEQLGSGVVLRWKSTGTATNRSSANPTAPTVQHVVSRADMNAQNAFSGNQANPSQTSGNPLRQTSGYGNASRVQPANYQQDPTDPFSNPFGEDRGGLPALPPNTNAQPSLPGIGMPQELPRTNLPDLPDPLQAPEAAPAPDSIPEQPRANPFSDPNNQSMAPSASDNEREPEFIPLPDSPQVGGDGSNLDLPDRIGRNSNSISCDELRDRIRARPLTQVSLDVSPSFGEGLRSNRENTEQRRLEFAARSEIRDWSDNTGLMVTTGRLVDLRDDRVVLDVGGRERTILLRDLSDVDIAYVGEVWNLPIKCGNGNSAYEGRNFVQSAVQWKAPGNCHKPLYFNEPQLERYGHEVGPVLQPLISTAHFFGNIAVLPYKMGIHPPNECQYSLGYYRPGNCAPYMLQPIPLSLRGGATQASFVAGAAGLIP